jgi:hypothetical protein
MNDVEHTSSAEPPSDKDSQLAKELLAMRDEASVDPDFQKFVDPNYLPTTREVEATFEGKQSKKYRLRSEAGQYEILTLEYVDGLASYMAQRAEELGREETLKVLEVGAGSGKLTRQLKKLLTEKNAEIELVATDKDDGKWGIPLGENVENLDYREALSKYKPDVVLCSWMPMDQDWSSAFRDQPSVKEYILIGEEATTGQEQATWGKQGAGDKKQTAFEKDGFARSDLDGLSDLQTWVPTLHSKTVSFRRIE